MVGAGGGKSSAEEGNGGGREERQVGEGKKVFRHLVDTCSGTAEMGVDRSGTSMDLFSPKRDWEDAPNRDQSVYADVNDHGTLTCVILEDPYPEKINELKNS